MRDILGIATLAVTLLSLLVGALVSWLVSRISSDVAKLRAEIAERYVSHDLCHERMSAPPRQLEPSRANLSA